MSAPRLIDLLADELYELLPPEEQAKRWSLEAFCDGHVQQLAACRDHSNWLHLLCDRQSGKTWTGFGILTDNAVEHENSLGVFLGLVGTGVKLLVWPIWKRHCEVWGLCSDDDHNETAMLTTFPNGARVVFGGTDDLSNVKKYLGGRLHNCVFLVDESQDQKRSLLVYLFVVLLPPMCTPTTRVIQAGVLPDTPSGYFLDTAAYDPKSETGGKGPGWKHHSWNRMANVHTPEAAQQLADHKARHNIPDDDPTLLRYWGGCQRVWDLSATAYRYSRVLAAYRPELAPWATPELLAPGHLVATVPHPALDRFAIGLDPAATADRFAIVLWGWSSMRRMGVWQVAEWSTDRGADALESQYLAVLACWRAHYGVIHRTIRDAGSSRTTNDVIYRSHGIMIEPAIKGPGSLRARVDRLSDLLAGGEAHVIEGSCLEEDLVKAKWDKDARARGEYEWDSSHHPDVADAASYAIVAYTEAVPRPKPPETRAPDVVLAAALEEGRRKQFELAAKPKPALPPRTNLWGGKPPGW